jgi:hypothetical protein
MASESHKTAGDPAASGASSAIAEVVRSGIGRAFAPSVRRTTPVRMPILATESAAK